MFERIGEMRLQKRARVNVALVLLSFATPAFTQNRPVDVTPFIPGKSASLHDLYFEAMPYNLNESEQIGAPPRTGHLVDIVMRKQETTVFPCLQKNLFVEDIEFWTRSYRGLVFSYRFEYAMKRKPMDSELAQFHRIANDFDYLDLIERQERLTHTLYMVKRQMKVGAQCLEE